MLNNCWAITAGSHRWCSHVDLGDIYTSFNSEIMWLLYSHFYTMFKRDLDNSMKISVYLYIFFLFLLKAKIAYILLSEMILISHHTCNPHPHRNLSDFFLNPILSIVLPSFRIIFPSRFMFTFLFVLTRLYSSSPFCWLYFFWQCVPSVPILHVWATSHWGL